MKTSQSSTNDPAGLFLKSVTLPQKSPIIQLPAVDTHNIKSAPDIVKCSKLSDVLLCGTNPQGATTNHRSDADVWNLNQLHKSNNCSNCGKFVCGKCKVHKYSMPYQVIDCEQWEYRGKKA